MLSAGELDPTFGSGGKVMSQFRTEGDSAAGLALQTDGKIVVVGTSVARYNSDGTLDTGFGNQGTAPSPFGGSASAVAIQADGRIVIVGPAAVARYNTNGTLDAGFGRNGISSATFSPTGVVLLPDGRIVVTGLADSLLALARYNADGTIDTAFGHGGLNTTPLSRSPAYHADAAVAIQPDGKIVIASGIDVVRYNPDGSLDTLFGTGGRVAVSYNMGIRSLVLQVDGRIVVAGSAGELVHGGVVEHLQFALARFNSNGTVDPTFGTAGQVTTSFEEMTPITFASIVSIALQTNGRIVATGQCCIFRHSIITSQNFVVARYNPDGSLDNSFGGGGRAFASFRGNDVASAVLLQRDGKILVAGTSFGQDFLTPRTGDNFALARFQADGRIANVNQRFIAQVYLDLLQRQADAAGLDHWSSLLDQGMSRSQVVFQIESSQEYHRLEVQRLYGLVLGRAVDPLGQNGWIDFLNKGGTAEQLEANLFGSAEYFTRTGGTNAGFLQAVYRDALGRTIDPAGASSWGQALAGGTIRSAVAAAILGSLESDRLEVDSLYRGFLRRRAEQGGLDIFTRVLQQGVSNEQILSIIVGSDEYFSRL